MSYNNYKWPLYNGSLHILLWIIIMFKKELKKLHNISYVDCIDDAISLFPRI